MLLTFKQKHDSIDVFDPTEIPDFTVLTGVNGSGKSHLLEAINQKKVVIAGLENAGTVLFNYETFRLENEPSFTGHQIAAEREAGWQYHQQHFINNVRSWRSQIGPSYEEIRENCKTEKRSLWSHGGDLIKQYKQNFQNFFRSGNHKKSAQAQAIYSLAKNIPYSIDEIDHDEFVARYKPFTLKNEFLPTQLGKIFWDYYVKQRTNSVNQFENAERNAGHSILNEEEFVAQHGEKPWVVANKILRSFDTLKYEFDSPEGADFFGNYKLRLLHTEKPDLEVEFDKLSSGERVLMALVASIYKASSDRNFPDLLLLDEVDASLHPSMMKNMLQVVEDILLPQGVKVILVTHSPTTIALAPEESIFVMNPTGPERIVKKNQNEALEILTQGFATIDQGLRLYDQLASAKLTIITEGNNTKFITKALEFGGVSGVDVLEGIEGMSGKNQLKTLFEFFSRMQHSNKILFVWDSDVNFNLVACGNTFPYIFENNPENWVSKHGIENLFPPALFQKFSDVTHKSDGTVETVFDYTKKREFEEYVMGRNDPSDFEKFNHLLDRVKEIQRD